MAVMAQWRDMTWSITTQAVRSLESLSLSKALDTKQQESRSGQDQTNVRGYKAQSVPVTYTVGLAAGVDPRAEYERWLARIGKAGPLLLGGKRFGPRRLLLEVVSLDTEDLAPGGRILLGEIGLTFSEETAALSGQVTTTADGRETALLVGPTAAAKKSMLEG